MVYIIQQQTVFFMLSFLKRMFILFVINCIFTPDQRTSNAPFICGQPWYYSSQISLVRERTS